MVDRSTHSLCDPSNFHEPVKLSVIHGFVDKPSGLCIIYSATAEHNKKMSCSPECKIRKDEGFALPPGLVLTVQVRPNSLPNVSTLYLRSCRSSESVKAEGYHRLSIPSTPTQDVDGGSDRGWRFLIVRSRGSTPTQWDSDRDERTNLIQNKRQKETSRVVVVAIASGAVSVLQKDTKQLSNCPCERKHTTVAAMVSVSFPARKPFGKRAELLHGWRLSRRVTINQTLQRMLMRKNNAKVVSCRRVGKFVDSSDVCELADEQGAATPPLDPEKFGRVLMRKVAVNWWALMLDSPQKSLVFQDNCYCDTICFLSDRTSSGGDICRSGAHNMADLRPVSAQNAAFRHATHLLATVYVRVSLCDRIWWRSSFGGRPSRIKVLGVGEKVSSTVAGMTVQDEVRTMPQTAATRSRFMITDILSGPADGAAIIRGRSPSPGPRDLSLHSNPIHDSDTDSSGHPDNSSVCSNASTTPIDHTKNFERSIPFAENKTIVRHRSHFHATHLARSMPVFVTVLPRLH
ncbi:hypothetical protein GEV33_010152 [Tenebrio molitor]|uniref:Uncharacterized protein n=1 Tax=Tenebrio molitor TaxID=7067 RepID=A0A8J6HD91_TENMO|nr:hypothetical protein GEV33_010152 [Tenebrio molitor]